MTNKQILIEHKATFNNSDRYKVIGLMDAARKDEFFKTLDFISGLGLVEDGGVWIQAAGNGTAWTENQLYEQFKKEK